MKRILLIVVILSSVISSCINDDIGTRTSGTDTIDNIRYFSTTYFVYGFLFSEAKLVPTSKDPEPDITVDVISDTLGSRLYFQTNNFKPSFHKVGSYPDENSAITAFDNLKEVSVSQWVDLADSIDVNQVWLYRNGGDHYAKIRIISTVNEERDEITYRYGECTFKWEYQPDGSETFPVK